MALVLGTNSYATVAEATAILADRSDSADWVSAGLLVQAKALVTATSVIDERSWLGSAVSASQSLGWPRTGVRYIDPKLNLTVTPADDEIPDRVKKATALLALHFIQNPTAYASSESIAESITVGPISIQDSNTKTKTVKMPKSVMDYISCLTTRGAGGYSWWRAN